VTGRDSADSAEGWVTLKTEKIKKSMMNEGKLNYRVIWKHKYFPDSIMAE